MTHAIEMNQVRKTFGTKVAVEGLDLTIERGSLLGLIGPNGAGKTTSIRMIMSILFPDSGELSVLGKRSAVESKDLIGYLPEERGIYKKMKVGQFLKYMARLKGVPADGLTRKVRGWLERIELPEVWDKKCEELSKGMQQKVQFIASVVHDPELIILDEPFSGLDPVNMRLLRSLINELHASGKTVIFSTHVMAQAQDQCDQVVMIHKGRKVLDGSLDRIRAAHETRRIAFEPLNGSAEAAAGIAGVASVRRADRGYEAELADGADPSAVLAGIAGAVPVSRIEVHRPSLEDIFIGIVTGSGERLADEEALRAELRGGPGLSEDEGVTP